MEFIDLVVVPREIREAWACTEALRRLGFDPDTVLVTPDSRDHHLKVHLRVGPHGWSYDCGPMTLDADDFIDLWAELVFDLIKDNIPHELLDQTWNMSSVKFNFPDIVDDLHEEGFTIPLLDEEAAVSGTV